MQTAHYLSYLVTNEAKLLNIDGIEIMINSKIYFETSKPSLLTRSRENMVDVAKLMRFSSASILA